jgi:hypothetical protein
MRSKDYILNFLLESLVEALKNNKKMNQLSQTSLQILIQQSAINNAEKFNALECEKIIIAMDNIFIKDINDKKVEALEGEAFSFGAKFFAEVKNDVYNLDRSTWRYNPDACVTDYDLIRANRNYKNLVLKKGVPIFTTKNDTLYKNGTYGVVLNFGPDEILIGLKDEKRIVIRQVIFTINIHEYSYKYYQFPIYIGYAATIRKVQGLTLDLPMKLIPSRSTTLTDVYVFCSRTTHLKNLYFEYPIDAHYTFYKQC